MALNYQQHAARVFDPDCRRQAVTGAQRCEHHLQTLAKVLARLWSVSPPAFGWMLIRQQPPRHAGGRPPKKNPTQNSAEGLAIASP